MSEVIEGWLLMRCSPPMGQQQEARKLITLEMHHLVKKEMMQRRLSCICSLQPRPQHVHRKGPQASLRCMCLSPLGQPKRMRARPRLTRPLGVEQGISTHPRQYISGQAFSHIYFTSKVALATSPKLECREWCKKRWQTLRFDEVDASWY
jgi:hypothetical protein